MRSTRIARRFARRLSYLTILAVLSALISVLAGQTPAFADTPAINGTSWMEGQGANACNMNGTYTSVCGGENAVGTPWECVELAQRVYQDEGWYSGDFYGVTYAYQIYGQASALGMTWQQNGYITDIVPGDMIVHNYSSTNLTTDPIGNNNAGHVAIVDYVDSSGVHVVEQNYGGGYAHQAVYGFSGGTLTRTLNDVDGNPMPILGIVHSPDNTFTTDYLVVLYSNGTIYGKQPLADSYTPLDTNDTATSVQAAGARIAFLDSSGNLYAKDTLAGDWVEEESSDVSQYLVTPDLLLVLTTGGTLKAKAGLSDTWSTVATSVTNFQATGNEIAYTSGGDVYAKNGLSAVPTDMSSGVTQYVVTPNYFVMLLSGNVYGKPMSALGGSWTTMETGEGATNLEAAGQMMAWTDSSGNVWAQNGFSGTAYDESSGVSQYVVTPYNFVMLLSGNIYGKAASALNLGWEDLYLGGDATSIASANQRIAYENSSGDLIAKDGLAGSWSSTEATSFSQYVVS